MAFLRTADAVIARPTLHLKDWNDLRTSHLLSKNTEYFVKSAALDLSEYSSDRYLLTHSTIIASVDTQEVAGVKLGSFEESGNTVNRKYADYYVTSETQQYINDNRDCWERELLLATFRTFIGGENYVEHVQIPELSKGKIIDAVARDLGDTVYIDILVATDRCHKALVADIESGKMAALSMGCSIQFSICTKCGNVAADETELCPCIKYEKGNTFIDSSGVKRIIAELCGHRDDPHSVVFFEASWVGNPAFKGATTRSILNPSGSNPSPSVIDMGSLFAQSSLLQEFMATRDLDRYLYASDQKSVLTNLHEELRKMCAHTKSSFGFDEDKEDMSSDKKKLLEQVKDEVSDEVKEELVRKLKEELGEELGTRTEKKFEGDALKADLNKSIINAFQDFSQKYAKDLRDPETLRQVFCAVETANAEGWSSLKTQGYTNRTILAALYLYSRDVLGEPLTGKNMAILSKVGGKDQYKTLKAFLTSCELAMGRPLSRNEAASFIRVSSYLN